MLKDGLYSLKFRDDQDAELDSAETMAVVRDGRILGTDPLGGVFSGHYKSQSSETSAIVDLQMQVPPESTLVTGHTTQSRERLLAITGTLVTDTTGTQADVMVLGQKVKVHLTYLGSVPH